MRSRSPAGSRPPLTLVLAALVTAANAAKPATVDDTAYLLFARHLAAHPADPYGFDIFWWSAPEPAMGVLLPPLLPYWLALGIKLFGEHVALLKLWLFPFVWLLAWALGALLRRFARGAERFALPPLVLSAAVLPTLNLMLDVPAVALALASVELFARASARRDWRLAMLSGLVAALAMQTKYSAFVAPAAILWFGLTHRRVAFAVRSVGVCAAAFVAWELSLVPLYEESHFAHHAGASGGPPGLVKKLDLIGPLAGYLGCLAAGAGLLALSVLRLPRGVTVCAAALWGIGFALVALLPNRLTALAPDVTLAGAFWPLAGAVWYLATAACAGVLLLRVRNGLSVRTHRAALFVVGWFVIEVVAALALTPFAAARRVIGVSLVMGLLAARAASRLGRVDPARRPPRWVPAFGIAVGVLVAAIDAFDAYPERVCAERAAALVRADGAPPGATAWYTGHWGFQYYCEREGMRALVVGRTAARAGDYLVLPVYPDGDDFPRPHTGSGVPHPPAAVADPLGDVLWDDPLSAKTVPNFYGGTDPVAGRDAPRLRVRVYRVKAEWEVR